MFKVIFSVAMLSTLGSSYLEPQGLLRYPRNFQGSNFGGQPWGPFLPPPMAFNGPYGFGMGPPPLSQFGSFGPAPGFQPFGFGNNGFGFPPPRFGPFYPPPYPNFGTQSTVAIPTMIPSSSTPATTSTTTTVPLIDK